MPDVILVLNHSSLDIGGIADHNIETAFLHNPVKLDKPVEGSVGFPPTRKRGFITGRNSIVT